MANPSAPVFLQLFQADAAEVRAELMQGLTAQPAHVAPKFLYGPLGSVLFDAITLLEEYYPTRTEAAIFASHVDEIAAFCGTGRPLVDLGAGDCAKAASLFAALQPSLYVAVDISVEFLRQALTRWQQAFPQLPMLGLGMDFSRQLVLPPAVTDGPRLLFYPGSSIGNFSPDEALRFLRQAHAASQGGTLLIGVDLVKPVDVLEAAYDDALGVTGAFNLNLLRNLNALLDADFDVRQWAHLALFNRAASRIEMHLQARTDLTVRWPGGERPFTAGERLHTENSYKYEADDFAALLRDAGFRALRCWTDDRRWFAVFAARARGAGSVRQATAASEDGTAPHWHWEGERLHLSLLGKPGARRDAFGRVHDGRLQVQIACVPEDGRATERLLAFLAGQFGVARRSVTLLHGRTSARRR